MRSLANEMKDGISEKYHQRIDEFCKALNCSQGFEVVHMRNSVAAKNHILKVTRDKAGYRIISSNVITISGMITYKPYLRILGDFAIVLVSSKYMDAANRIVREDKQVVVYENGSKGSAEVPQYASLYS